MGEAPGVGGIQHAANDAGTRGRQCMQGESSATIARCGRLKYLHHGPQRVSRNLGKLRSGFPTAWFSPGRELVLTRVRLGVKGVHLLGAV